MKRILQIFRGQNRRSTSLPDAALRPCRRFTTADRQAVHGLLSVANLLSATLRA